MRLIVIADAYPPVRISGAVQMRDLVKEFVLQGHEPTVVVPSPNLDSSWKIEEGDGIRVLRVRTPRTKDIGYFRRTINEMLLPYVLLRAIRNAKLSEQRWDGVIWYSPTIFLGPVVRSLRRKNNCRSYLILRDIFPEWAVDMGLMRRGIPYWFFKWIERNQYQVADTIGVQTHANLPYLSEWANKPARKLEVLQNWLSEAKVAECSIDISNSKLSNRKIFVYTGNMGVAQGMEVFIDLAVKLRNRSDIGFLFVGRGSEAAHFMEIVSRERLTNVMFHDEIEPREIPGLLAQCHVGIVALDIRHKSHNIPGKFLSYIQAGLPVLARINPGNDLEKLINKERVGRVCTGGDATVLEELTEKLLADQVESVELKSRAKLLAQRLFSSTSAVQQIVNSLQATTSHKNQLKVLMLNQAFWPDVVATAQHADDLARYLRENGDDVTVVASRAIYGERGSTLPKRETRDGIQIYRVGLQLFGKRGITPRVFDFTLFYIAALWRCMMLPRHDVVICFTTPPFIALVGVLLKWIKGTRLVYWTMDLYPEVAGAAGVMKSNGALWNIFRWIDRICLRQSDRVVALGDYMKQKVIQKGAAPTRVSTISVWSGAEKFARRNRQDNPLRTEWNIGDRFTVLYVGNFGLGHDMDAIAGAVEKLKDDDSIRWLFIGDGKAKPNLERRISECGAKNIFVSGYQTREQLADVLDLGDTHLVTLLPGWEGLILPSKFFSVLAAGKPVLWVGPENSECVTILNENQCGYQSKPGDGDALAREIQYLSAHRSDAQEMGRRGQVAYEMKYESHHACKAWQDVLHTIVRPL